MNTIELSLFASRMEAVTEEMGAVLRQAAFSPNIRDRLDYSCAVFDASGHIIAQAAHIPVHLGSMAYAMHEVVARFDWAPGDAVVFNDPYAGGTHLPDVTVVEPVFHAGERVGFAANRAHHADIGAEAPGSMPVSTRLTEEGQVIAPQRLVRAGALDVSLLNAMTDALRDPGGARGDYQAQLSANRNGVQRLVGWVAAMGLEAFHDAVSALNTYGATLALATFQDIPAGCYRYTDYLDDDGQGTHRLPIGVELTVADNGQVRVDFAGSAAQVGGNVNCPLPVTAASVFYALRCLMPAHTPSCAGVFGAVEIQAPEGSLVNARPPAAVAAGNVETSTRIVDAMLGALAQALPERIPAASHGSMNNVALGSNESERPWAYYETLGGGMGAGATGGGLSACQTHMTNTLNTPVEVLETRFPLRVRRYQLRRGSGGAGARHGGEGLVREYEFLRPAEVTLLTERRMLEPWGLAGGKPGAPGENRLNDRSLPGKVQLAVQTGDRLSIATPGGGGWGKG